MSERPKPKHIENEAEYEAALGEIERLMSLPELDVEQRAELDAWACCCEDYERKMYPMGGR